MGEMAEHYEEMFYATYMAETMEREERYDLLAQGIWKTADGTRIPVKDMTDAHYANALALLRRKGAEDTARALEKARE